jgi:hypothetical protein
MWFMKLPTGLIMALFTLGKSTELVFVDLQKAQESISSLAGRHYNPFGVPAR